jgi:hypothetical protein
MPMAFSSRRYEVTLTRIVAQLDYDHEGPNREAQALVTSLFDYLETFAVGYPGLEVVVIGFAEANDDAEPSDPGEEDVGRQY